MRILVRLWAALLIWWVALLGMAALDNTRGSMLLNVSTPTGTAGIPGTYTALSAAGGMKIRLTGALSTPSAAGATISGSGYADYVITAASTASSALSNVTLPNVAGGTGGTTYWTNGSGGAWSIYSCELQDNANTRNLFGAFNGDPIAVANGNSFLIAQNAVTASAS
jgi:hypothetical protein